MILRWYYFLENGKNQEKKLCQMCNENILGISEFLTWCSNSFMTWSKLSSIEQSVFTIRSGFFGLSYSWSTPVKPAIRFLLLPSQNWLHRANAFNELVLKNFNAASFAGKSDFLNLLINSPHKSRQPEKVVYKSDILSGASQIAGQIVLYNLKISKYT